MWECVGGLIVKGEDSLQGALRETKEEVGVDLGNAVTDEMAQVIWMSREKIEELFGQKLFVETLEYFFTEVDK